MIFYTGRGEKYKIKVGKTLIATAGSFGDFGERKYLINYEDEEEN